MGGNLFEPKIIHEDSTPHCESSTCRTFNVEVVITQGPPRVWLLQSFYRHSGVTSGDATHSPFIRKEGPVLAPDSSYWNECTSIPPFCDGGIELYLSPRSYGPRQQSRSP